MTEIQYRYDVINFLSDTYYQGKAKYLEIGVEYPESCFDHIHASKKTSVDPAKIREGIHIDYQITSDEFFKRMRKGARDEIEFYPDHTWNIIFIDGLHLADQVYRDIQNSLLYCDGFIVLHDCKPENFWNAHSDYDYFQQNRHEWNGSTWKAFYKYRTETNRKTYTVDIDYGIGIIDTRKEDKPIRFDNPWFEFGKLKQNAKYDLGLITADEFRKMHTKPDDDFKWWNWRFEDENSIDYRP